MLLCAVGATDHVKRCLQFGAKVNATDSRGENALFYALSAPTPQREHLIKILLLQGGNYRQISDKGVA